MSVLAPIPPVEVTVIRESTGTGSPLTTGTIGTTPDHQPNVVVKVVTPIVAILVRFINTYLTGLVGLITGAGITGVITASDFLHLVYKCGALALAPAAIGMIKDIVTVFSGLEKQFPLGTGNV